MNKRRATTRDSYDVAAYAVYAVCHTVKLEASFESVIAGQGTGVNPARDAGDTSPQYFGWGTSTGISPPNIITYFRT